ncbi:hypothetical protein C8Q80DRAFT_393103 [Daedaleopsis nitida]|nr:hypothetical protein C8Q80DRAFT_393103 [Daedaleopsis nitida]
MDHLDSRRPHRSTLDGFCFCFCFCDSSPSLFALPGVRRRGVTPRRTFKLSTKYLHNRDREGSSCSITDTTYVYVVSAARSARDRLSSGQGTRKDHAWPSSKTPRAGRAGRTAAARHSWPHEHRAREPARSAYVASGSQAIFGLCPMPGAVPSRARQLPGRGDGAQAGRHMQLRVQDPVYKAPTDAGSDAVLAQATATVALYEGTGHVAFRALCIRLYYCKCAYHHTAVYTGRASAAAACIRMTRCPSPAYAARDPNLGAMHSSRCPRSASRCTWSPVGRWQGESCDRPSVSP